MSTGASSISSATSESATVSKSTVTQATSNGDISTPTQPTTAQSTPSDSPVYPPPAPLQCISDVYVIVRGDLIIINLGTGESQSIASGVGAVTAMGYNALDDLLYGARGRKLVRIGAGGATADVVQLPFAPSLGDVDTNGQYYGSDGVAWAQVDVRPGSARYGEVVATGKVVSHGGAQPPVDWAFTPAAPGWAYGVSVRGGTLVLMRWSVGSHEWETVRAYRDSRLRARRIDAVAATADGIVYAVDSTDGQAFRLSIGDAHSASRAGRFPTGFRRASFVRGARCAMLPDVVVS